MKTEELRIGNYVDFDSNVLQVQSVSKILVEAGNGLRCDGRYLKPVPLNEYWLLKCGFIRQPWGLVKGGLLFKDKNHNCEELTLEVGNGFRTTVNFLHQLQNLYFSLTGEEIIKL